MRIIGTLAMVASLTSTAAAAAPQAEPLARMVSREATRLAAKPNDSTGPPGRPAETEWSRVRRFAPGTELIVTTEGAAPQTRIFIRADDSELAMLNPSLVPSAAALRNLVDAVSMLREEFVARGRTFVRGRVALTADGGVFVDGRRVAGFQEIVEQVPRGAVVEITKLHAPVDAKIAAAIVGSVIGFYAGRPIGAAVQPSCRCGDQGFAGWIIGGPVGALVGGFGGAAMIRAKPVIVYRRP